MPPVEPVVSVVVPVRDGARTLGACLDALGHQALDAPVEVLVVDNGSTDDTASLAGSHPAVTQVIHEPRRGSYAARNAGIAVAAAPVLAFTDADGVPAPGWLAAGLDAIARGADLVGGAIEPLRSRAPTVWERYDTATYLDQADLVRQGFAATANLFVRRTVLDAIGPFDPALRSSGDLEFGRRARVAGFTLRFEPTAQVGHRPRTSARQTWALHRRLAAGWRELADRDLGAAPDEAPMLRMPLGRVVDLVAADGPPLRRRHLLAAHALVLAARGVGWWTRRG